MPEDMVEIKRKSGTRDEVCCLDDGFPWGTSISLDSGLVEELGVEALSVDDVVEIRGFAVVKHKSEQQDKSGVEKSMSLQITQLKVKREESDKATQLYG